MLHHPTSTQADNAVLTLASVWSLQRRVEGVSCPCFRHWFGRLVEGTQVVELTERNRPPPSGNVILGLAGAPVPPLPSSHDQLRGIF
jgi:hypothetical protein